MTLAERLRQVRDRLIGERSLPVPSPRSKWQPAFDILEGRCLPSSGMGSIAYNFNGTPIPAGDTIWFSSVMKVGGLPSSPVTLQFSNDTITYVVNGVTTTLNAPNATITLSPGVTTATTTFDAATNTWQTMLPMHFSGNALIDGFAYTLPTALPGGVKNVTWAGTFSSNTQGVSVNWQWGAAVYTNFSTDYNALNVKPVDDNHVSLYPNSDHAGTPELFKAFVTGGATGGGGSNFTGSLSSTQRVTPNVGTAGLGGHVDAPFEGSTIPVVGAIVTLTSGGQTFTTQTDQFGDYQFVDVPVGTYTLTLTPPFPASITEDVGMVNSSVDGVDLGNGMIGSIVLGSGDSGVGYNFHVV